jgi:hypothetical protein
MAGLDAIVQRHLFRPLPTDWENDMRRGLRVISTRSEALGRFIGSRASAHQPAAQCGVARLRLPV